IVHLGTTTREGLVVLFEKPATAIFTIRKAGYLTVERTVRVTPLWELPYWSLEHRPPTIIVVPLQLVSAEAPAPKTEESRGGPQGGAHGPTCRPPRVSRPPRLEEFLKGGPPAAEARITDFRPREPGDGVPASKETSAYLSYDHKNLYVVVVCREEPGKIRA